ncbi:MAG: hypothetical protein ACE5JS_00970 [Nitrospinota bacterium]
MRHVLKFVLGFLLIALLGGCSTHSTPVDYEPISSEEEENYRVNFYLKMTPGQRNYYERLPNRAERDAYLRELGLIKSKKRRR